ncbi:MAG TPA: DUF5103 domain-containing protein, partial [Flavobacteriaceae bacterium]|nr:DUF5103 domain-containing protein [Flavobacteriaceae bacterium]
MYYKTYIITFVLFLNQFIFAQNDIEVLEPSYIKSIKLHARKINAVAPIIRLGEMLQFSFDDLECDEKEY